MLAIKQVRVPVRGSELYAECAGTGPPVVLLQSGLLDASMWDEQLEPLAAAYTVVRYDARSHGRSSTAVGDYRDDDDLLRRARRVRPARGCPGGPVDGRADRGRLRLGPPRPSHVQGAGRPWDQPYAVHRPVRPRAACRAGGGDRGVGRRAVRPGISALRGGRARRGPADTDPAVRHRCAVIARANVATHHSAVGAAIERDAMARLEDIATPTLLLVGELELPDVRPVVDEATRHLPNATRLEIPGAGHMLNLERPDLFNAAVLDHPGQSGD